MIDYCVSLRPDHMVPQKTLLTMLDISPIEFFGSVSSRDMDEMTVCDGDGRLRHPTFR